MRRIIATMLTGAALGLFAACGSAWAQDGTEVDPLLEVAADMNAAALKLAKLHTDTPTQAAQRAALAKLDELIARLEEEERQRGRGGQGKQPARDSTITQGPGGMGTLHADRREGKQWGELPPKRARADPAIDERRLPEPLSKNPRALFRSPGRRKTAGRR